MGNNLRCCLACVLPCGALDLIRIVHLNGYVEEITRSITAGEVLKANPNHVLSKPSSHGVVRRILILSPETELKRGNIYFLVPSSSSPESKTYAGNLSIDDSDLKKKFPSKKTKQCSSSPHHKGYLVGNDNNKVPKEKIKPSRRDRRRGRVGIWRPHLESIFEE
ncbi:hypothetical protein TanjilG_21439 [Lupinus angustifolius]|uniref:DUF4228 domain-containing protein n=1 Tax=Lupinus angustifolius TaxID=3871 RepID=A0A4P1RN72_LUPAN|nr:PREDICTED: uncharacterized protein LOC109344987 [Lupinus angustifolius]OIW14299.1 hypothetical protein TanjilG_21439 [Lupinus angustifolius]